MYRNKIETTFKGSEFVEEMEEQISNAETERHLMEGEATVVLDKIKLREVIANGSLDFDEWTSLIVEIEKTYPENIETICLVYDAFLSEFPLCCVYWRKYVNHKIRLCTIDKVLEVFERAVSLATYSVDVWVDYCNFGRAVFEDPSDVRRLFKRALSFVGKDYLCHTLWDKYIEFEFSLKHWSFLADIYIQTLRFPTKKLHRYYDSFKKLVEIWKDEMESHGLLNTTISVEPMLDSEASICSNQDDISCIIKDLLDPSAGLERSKALRRYISVGEQFFHEASQLNENISCYETRIKRSYFHVKPLDVNQLENWHHYLDFAESHGDFDWAVRLYERCLIPCANYPDFWMRYVEFMESKGGREIANFALDRVTQNFLKRVSVIHLFNARFKEHVGDVPSARSAFLQCNNESDSEFVENVVMRANMEKRIGNFIAASNIYEEALGMATVKEKWHVLPILYVNFSRLKYMNTDGEDAARDILIDGIKHAPYSKLLIEELIKFAISHGGIRHMNMVDTIVANAISPRPSVSLGLSAKDGEEISKLYLEFVDLCGSIHDVRKAWNRHIRLFPQSVRATLFHPATGTKQWKIVMEAQAESPVRLDFHPSGDGSSDCLMQSSVQEEKLSSPKSHDTKAAHPPTDQVSDQKSRLEGKQDIICDQVPFQEPALLEIVKELSETDQAIVHQTKVELHQSGESDKNVNEIVDQGSLDVLELSEKDVLESNPSLDLKHQAANDSEITPPSMEFPKEYDVQIEYDHEPELDLKPPSLEQLSLNNENAKSPDSISPASCDSGAHREISLSDGSMPNNEAPQKNSMSHENMSECGQNADDDRITSSPGSSQAAVSAQTNIGYVSPTSSASYQNKAQALLQPQKMADDGRNWHQKNNPDRSRRDSKLGFRGHSHKRQQKQGQSSPQRTRMRDEKEPQIHMNEDYASQPWSLRDLQVQQAGQVQSWYPASTVHINQTTPQAWPVYNMQQQSISPACQSQPPVQPAAYPQPQMTQHPIQSSEQPCNAQNNQAYNQMWQHYYYQQQQQLLWQQQQLLKHQQPNKQQLLQQYQQQFRQQQYQQQLIQMQQQQQGQQLQPQQQQQQQVQQLQQQQGQLQQQQAYQLQQQSYQQQQHLLYLQHQQQVQQQQLLLQQQHFHQQQTALPQQHPHEQGQDQELPKKQNNTSQVQVSV
ncbi:uncharacterized protein LOC105649750 isoform X2 [Jatropha curcas]|nr:uncharacterized protein LOC105649750 isoform X2 [Jatropha curcas]